MKIVHLVLSDKFNEGWLYQHNLLALQNRMDGNEVSIITGCNSYSTSAGKDGECGAQRHIDSNGIKIIRLPRPKFIPAYLHYGKIRYYSVLPAVLEDENPDIVFLHGIQTFSLIPLSRYAKKHPNVRFYADNHADDFNTSKSFVGRRLLHGIVYAGLYKMFGGFFTKLFYVTPERRDFLISDYGLDEKKYKMEFLPLGGISYPDEKYKEIRESERRKLGLRDGDVAFVHSGKLEPRKHTLDDIKAFIDADAPNAKLFLAGSVTNSIRAEFEKLVESSDKVEYLGWKSPDELNALLCGCDVLLQTGSQSVIFEQGICFAMAAILDRADNNKFLLSEGNGIFAETHDEIVAAIRKLSSSPETLADMKLKAKKFSERELLYSSLVKKFY